VTGATEWLDLKDVAGDLEVSIRLLLRMARDGEFPEILLIGTKKKRVRRDLYEAWLTRSVLNPTTAAEEARDRKLGNREDCRTPLGSCATGLPRHGSAN